MSLGQAAKDQVYLIECTRCKHKAQIDLTAMAKELGESFPLLELKARLKCSKCASKQTIFTTLWKSSTATANFVKDFLKGRP